MTPISISTAYLGNSMLPVVAQADQQLTTLETESTTGQYANLGLQLGEQSGYEMSLRNADDVLESFSGANAVVNGQLSASADALSSITTSAQSALSALTTWTPGGPADSELATTGDSSLQGLITAANSTYAGSYLFSGVNTSEAPMAAYSSTSSSYSSLVSAFQTQFGCSPTSAAAGSISASDVTSFLSGAFDDQFVGGNWTSNWSSASSTDTTAEISPGQTVTTSTNTNTAGFQDLAQGYAMVSLLSDSSLSSSAKQAVVTAAMSSITAGSSAITATAANLGQVQSTLKQTDDDITTQMTLLKTQLGGLDNVSETQVATQLNTLTTVIETAYQVTAQLQKLSLAQYLPA